MLLKGARVLLTGASGGLGRALAHELARQGAALLLAGRDAGKLEDLAGALRGLGSEAAILALDLNDDQTPSRVAEAARAFGVDVLVHGAGVNSFALFEDETPERMETVLRVNLLAPMRLTRALLPGLMAKRRAAIVFVGSTFGSLPFPGFAAYSAAKAGLRGFAQALRRELGDTAVKVILVAPRAIATPLNGPAVEALNRRLGSRMDPPPEVAARIVAALAAGDAERHLGFPERLFAWLNGLAPRLIDHALRDKLPLIRGHARPGADLK